MATFDPRPVSVIVPERAPDSLTTLERRLELLRDAGADDVIVIEFTRELAARSAEEFAVEQLVGQLARELDHDHVVGARVAQQLETSLEGRQRVGRALRHDHRHRPRVERRHGGADAERVGVLDRRLHDAPVAEVHAVERAERHRPRRTHPSTGPGRTTSPSRCPSATR